MKELVPIALLTLLLATAACDADTLIGGPIAICTESGEQCQLPKGPLGVCERRPCSASETAPCFTCVSQH